MANRLTAYDPEFELFEGEGELPNENRPGLFGEMDEMALAAELLEIQDEQELDRFLEALVRRAGQAVGTGLPPSRANAICGVLKSALKQALPEAGKALGSLVAGPVGAGLGGRLASMGGAKLGLELEGLSHEDREFETARQLVRFAIEAVKNALSAPN